MIIKLKKTQPNPNCQQSHSLSKTNCLFVCKANTNICVLEIKGQEECVVYQEKMNLTFTLQKRKNKAFFENANTTLIPHNSFMLLHQIRRQIPPRKHS